MEEEEDSPRFLLYLLSAFVLFCPLKKIKKKMGEEVIS